MKNSIKIAILTLIIGCNLTLLAAEPGLAGKKLRAISAMQKIDGNVLHAADTNSPSDTPQAHHYFAVKIRSCTNDVQIAAITNAIYHAKP